MERARDSGSAAMSGIVKLVQDNQRSQQPGFLIYLPVYGQTEPTNLEERKEQLKGYIYTPFRSRDLFNSLFKGENLDVVFKLFSIEDGGEKTLVYEYGKPTDLQEEKELERVERFQLLGREYLISFSTVPAFRQKSVRYGPIFVALFGLLVTLLLLKLFSLSQKQAEDSRKATERIEKEAQHLRESEEALSKALQVRNEFLSIASHELKTPLTALQLQLQLGLKSGKAGQLVEEGKFMKVMKMSLLQVSRLSRLVDDLLDVTRIEAGKLKFHKEDCDLTQLTEDTVERLEEHLKASGCTVSKEIDREVWAGVDAFRIEQVLSNILMNCAKYSPNSEVIVKLSKNSKNALLEIEDQGPGIPPELHERIFERFERAADTKGVSGLGLGLFISREIITAHGGRMWVESEIGKGARFYIEIPVKS